MKRIAMLLLCLPCIAYAAKPDANHAKPAEPATTTGRGPTQAAISRSKPGSVWSRTARLLSSSGTARNSPCRSLSCPSLTGRFIKDKLLADNRAEHTSWINIKAQGLRSVTNNNAITVLGTNRNGPYLTPYLGTQHNYNRTQEKIHYSRPIPGRSSELR